MLMQAPYSGIPPSADIATLRYRASSCRTLSHAGQPKPNERTDGLFHSIPGVPAKVTDLSWWPTRVTFWQFGKLAKMLR
jgi:hypothetical protein